MRIFAVLKLLAALAVALFAISVGLLVRTPRTYNSLIRQSIHYFARPHDDTFSLTPIIDSDATWTASDFAEEGDEAANIFGDPSSSGSSSSGSSSSGGGGGGGESDSSRSGANRINHTGQRGWREVLQPDEIQACEAAVQRVKQSGKSMHDLTAEDFYFGPSIARRVRLWQRELVDPTRKG